MTIRHSHYSSFYTPTPTHSYTQVDSLDLQLHDALIQASSNASSLTEHAALVRHAAAIATLPQLKAAVQQELDRLYAATMGMCGGVRVVVCMGWCVCVGVRVVVCGGGVQDTRLLVDDMTCIFECVGV